MTRGKLLKEILIYTIYNDVYVGKEFANTELEIELTSFIDNKQNVWFKGKDVALILGYSNTTDAIKRQVDSEDKQLICWRPQNGDGNKSDLRGKYYTFIISLVFTLWYRPQN